MTAVILYRRSYYDRRHGARSSTGREVGMPRSPRERMVFSAAQLIRRNGVAGTGMREVVAHAEAPRGSLQHYFPGGKDQLVAEAARWGGDYAAKRVDKFLAALPEPTPGALLAAMAGQWREDFLSDEYRAGCP